MNFYPVHVTTRLLQTQESAYYLEFISVLNMKAVVYVTLKPSVLDPQGKAIHYSLELLGHKNISDIRQGKYFEIAVNDSVSESDAKASVERIAKDVLANPVIEEYSIEISE